MIMLAPPDDGVGRPFFPAAPAGVGPLCSDVALSETGAESSLTLMIRWSSRTSEKNLAWIHEYDIGHDPLAQDVGSPLLRMVQRKKSRLVHRPWDSWHQPRPVDQPHPPHGHR